MKYKVEFGTKTHPDKIIKIANDNFIGLHDIDYKELVTTRKTHSGVFKGYEVCISCEKVEDKDFIIKNYDKVIFRAS